MARADDNVERFHQVGGGRIVLWFLLMLEELLAKRFGFLTNAGIRQEIFHFLFGLGQVFGGKDRVGEGHLGAPELTLERFVFHLVFRIEGVAESLRFLRNRC